MTYYNDVEQANKRIQELETENSLLRGGMEYLEKSKVPWLEDRIKELYDTMLRALEDTAFELMAWGSALPDGDLRAAIAYRMDKIRFVIEKAKGETPCFTP